MKKKNTFKYNDNKKYNYLSQNFSDKTFIHSNHNILISTIINYGLVNIFKNNCKV